MKTLNRSLLIPGTEGPNAGAMGRLMPATTSNGGFRNTNILQRSDSDRATLYSIACDIVIRQNATMHTLLKAAAAVCLASAAILFLPSQAAAQASPDVEEAPVPTLNLTDMPLVPGLPSLTVRSGDHVAHIFPSIGNHAQIAQSVVDNGPVTYNGGPVMGPASVYIYTIYWLPSTLKLQNGAATSMAPNYESVLQALTLYYGGHSIAVNNTQYYSVSGATKTYLPSSGVRAGSYIDTHPYPASGCSDVVTLTNCITDAQIRTEIGNVMAAAGWTGGLTKLFILFTSSGEGSCFDSTGNSCAYSGKVSGYCGYHSYIAGTPPIIYANEPYGNPTYCQIPGAPSPNGNTATDTATSIVTHEITESITDPELNAWFTFYGNEIGDLCAYDYGLAGWDSGNANQMWGGWNFELQMEYDNHTGQCVQVGP